MKSVAIDSKYYEVAAAIYSYACKEATRIFDFDESRVLEFTSIIQKLGNSFQLHGHYYRTDRTVAVDSFCIASWVKK